MLKKSEKDKWLSAMQSEREEEGSKVSKARQKRKAATESKVKAPKANPDAVSQRAIRRSVISDQRCPLPDKRPRTSQSQNTHQRNACAPTLAQHSLAGQCGSWIQVKIMLGEHKHVVVFDICLPTTDGMRYAN